MNRTKPLFLALCAILLVASTILGTVAYLQDSAEVVNTFTVGNVHLKLDEAVVDEKGEPTGGRTAAGNAYHLVPGGSYTKDPTVTVLKGSEKAYVRMLVTVNCYNELAAIFGDPFLAKVLTGWNDTLWLDTGIVTKDASANTATYEFRYYKTVKGEANADTVLEPLFETLTVPAAVTGEQLATIAALKIPVEAHAIQEAGFANADEAWAAFSK